LHRKQRIALRADKYGLVVYEGFAAVLLLRLNFIHLWEKRNDKSSVVLCAVHACNLVFELFTQGCICPDPFKKQQPSVVEKPADFQGVLFATFGMHLCQLSHQCLSHSVQRYHVKSPLVAGRGFWGNFAENTLRRRKRMSKLLAKAPRVLPAIKHLAP